MESDDRETELRQELLRELRGVETDVEELRASAVSLRQQIGERWFEPTDASERAALITAAEEQEALAETLEARREDLRKLVDRPG